MNISYILNQEQKANVTVRLFYKKKGEEVIWEERLSAQFLCYAALLGECR